MRISDWSSDVCSSELASSIGALHERPKALPESIGVLPAKTRSSFKRPGIHPLFTAAKRRHVFLAGRLQRNFGYARSGIRQMDDKHPRCWSYRSEEHTSELQSLMRISYAVFCLKKKKSTVNTLHLLPLIP